ncbi:hypothetical protein [Microscilla marina]|uniref:Lipoprotein, putative n=1 Tax=Microscilla marina ATCC 23134 TaxID=313606 RepID=A1ZEF5_MICM2|nr:hypothetical protein [Microscilla marina]EAY31463.1 lipoprotein, putative [Microscilla marina ATCC 23134]
MKQNYYLALFAFCLLIGLQACGGEDKGNNIQQGTDTTTAQNAKDSAQTKAVTEKTVSVNPKLTAHAYLFAGLTPDNKGEMDQIFEQQGAKQHLKLFGQQWQKLENTRLKNMRKWRETELTKLNGETHNLFYPFSGPDFINAYEFFPNCDNYLMFGLEKVGNLPDFSKENAGFVSGYLSNVRNALGEIFQRNYFITTFMGSELNTNVQGVAPILLTFLARTNNHIVKVEKIQLQKDGTPKAFPLDEKLDPKKSVVGLMIEFLGKDKTKPQRIYYFGTDVRDAQMPKKMELSKFIKSFPHKISFVKSCQYTLHESQFKVMRNLILNDTEAVLQDDTGVRYEVLKENGWKVKLYGKYAWPIADFGKYTYQPKLKQAFAKDSSVKPLNFTYGYHWNTDNTSVILAFKK